jgi:hypothetical protein
MEHTAELEATEDEQRLPPPQQHHRSTEHIVQAVEDE